jgi:ankyrin repeat domain-containing protein 50
LWVSADPGCGKSVLSRFLVEEELCNVKSQESLHATVCFFFFKDDNDEQKSASAALCALLHQILSQRKSLVRHAMPAFEANGKKLREMFQTLWNILIAAAADPDCGNVVCIIDALDECEELSRGPLLESLVRFFSKSTDTEEKSFLKAIVTSRPYPTIERKLDPLQKLYFRKFRLRAEEETDGIIDDIERVVKARVKTIGSMKKIAVATLTDLEKRLINNADRTFLWVTLILDIIENSEESSVADINQTISTLPSEVDAVYNNILRHSRDEGKARKVLHIVVAAARPLSLKEMNVAYAIESSDSSDLQNRLQPSIESTVRGICGLFVKVVDKRFYLVHQTAKEFLVKPSNCSASSLGPWKYSLDPAESHLVLVKICISYLLFAIFESQPLAIEKAMTLRPKKAVDRYTRRHYFLDYAANHWAVHFQGAKTEETAVLESILEVCDTRSERFLTWFQVYWITINPYSGCPQGFTELMVGSYFGHETVVRLLLDKGAAVDVKDNMYGRTPLSWAAGRGHEAVVRLLLDKGAAVDAKDTKNRQTPLSCAAGRGHEAVVRLLLDKGATVDAKDTQHGQTPLSWAAKGGHEAVVRLLLDKGAAVDGKTLSMVRRRCCTLQREGTRPWYGSYSTKAPRWMARILGMIGHRCRGLQREDTRPWCGPCSTRAPRWMPRILSMVRRRCRGLQREGTKPWYGSFSTRARGGCQGHSVWSDTAVEGCSARARGTGTAPSRQGRRCGWQGHSIWSDATVVGCRGRARGRGTAPS